MSTNFPTSLDSLTNPAISDKQNSPSHAGQHANSNDAIEALEAKVGADSSAVATSIDYLLKNASSSNPGHTHTGMLSAKVVQVTRDMTAASGDVSTTGVGFQPKALFFVGWINTTNHWGVGMAASDLTMNTVVGTQNGTSNIMAGYNATSSKCIELHTGAAGAGQAAAITSMDADGFTLTWTKTGSPDSETAWIMVLCLA